MTLLFWTLLACAPLTEESVCAEASFLLSDCGVSLPYLEEQACVGARVAMAECVLENAGDCADVAELHMHYEDCLADYIGEADTVPETVPYVGGDDEEDAEAENTDPLCSDGLDNDGDGAVDCGDEDCTTSMTVTICD